jgi:hypothetical protein
MSTQERGRGQFRNGTGAGEARSGLGQAAKSS